MIGYLIPGKSMKDVIADLDKKIEELHKKENPRAHGVHLLETIRASMIKKLEMQGKDGQC